MTRYLVAKVIRKVSKETKVVGTRESPRPIQVSNCSADSLRLIKKQKSQFKKKFGRKIMLLTKKYCKELSKMKKNVIKLFEQKAYFGLFTLSTHFREVFWQRQE